ncbi:MAG: adenine phosphoribosyltransferase [Bradymonadaceae bacterium]
MTTGELETRLKSAIRNVPDFPEEGVTYRDITPILHDVELFHDLTMHFRDRYDGEEIDHVAAIESRGFIFGGALAQALDTSMSLVRKPGKLPRETYTVEYELEYGTDTLELHTDAMSEGAQVLVVDDLLATGGTCRAANRLVERAGGEIVECAFVIELTSLGGRDRLTGWDVHSLATYE